MRFGRLLRGNILGVVDSTGVVHSEFTGGEIKHHSEHFPGHHHCRWRWNHRESIHWFLSETRPNEEQYIAIQNHLTKKYRLRWWDNGHHDVDHLLAMIEKENDNQ